MIVHLLSSLPAKFSRTGPKILWWTRNVVKKREMAKDTQLPIKKKGCCSCSLKYQHSDLIKLLLKTSHPTVKLAIQRMFEQNRWGMSYRKEVG